MEEKLKGYYDLVSSVSDPVERAKRVLILLTGEQAELCLKTNQAIASSSLDEALEFYYTRKECGYIRNLLENYIHFGHLDLPNEMIDTVHRLERFQRLRELLAGLLPVSVPVKG